MRTITPEELYTILENHKHWLKEDCVGWETMRADLRGADLREAYLSRVNLRGADLSGADLSRADLSGANLSGAYLSVADLSGADLSRADLSGANFSGAYLSGADLSRADLSGANFSEAYLSRADLSGANLSGAYLSGAYLSVADLSGADLREAENLPFIPLACPDSGSFIGWKKIKNYIIKLQIPEDAKRSSATTTKCRCDKALVLAIENADGTLANLTEVINTNYKKCTYKVGEMVYPDSFDEDRWNECSHGIHFFINRQEAVDW